MDGVDVGMDLAALSNDPVGDLDPTKTYEINHQGRARVAKLSKESGVPRYILASSASIFGQVEGTATEDSQVFPLTAYSKANRKAEINNLALNDEEFNKIKEISAKIKKETFNLVNETVTVKEVAEICKKHNSKVKIKTTSDQVPNLGYALSNKKLLNTGFKFLYNLNTAI